MKSMNSGFGAMKARNLMEKNIIANYTCDPEKDLGVTFTNTGASGNVVVSLPDATVGMSYKARVTVGTHTIKFDPQSDEDITNVSGTALTDGYYIVSNGDGNESIELTCYSDGHWTVTEKSGTWVVET